MDLNRVMDPNRTYSVSEMAKILHVKTEVMYDLVKRGDFPYVKLYERGEIRICGWQVKEWMDAHCRMIPADKEA